MVNNRMVITFEEPKTLDEAYQIRHVLRTVADLQADYNGLVVDRFYTSGFEMTKIDGEWFVWYRKIVLYINDNYANKIKKEVEKPYYVL